MRQKNSRRRRSGLTLVEVTLAVGIATGLLGTVLALYQQVGSLREAINEELKVVSSARLFLERISREIQAAGIDNASGFQFRGTRDSIEFVTTVLPDESAWRSGGGSARVLRHSDLTRVGYRLRFRTDASRPVRRASESGPSTEEISFARTDRTGLEGVVQIPNVSDSPPPDDPQATVILERSELRVLSAIDSGQGLPVVTQPVSDRLRYLRFRYFDGNLWSDEWQHPWLPRGVEITVSGDSLPREAKSGEEPDGIFRRVTSVIVSETLGPYGRLRGTQ